jgi:quinol monooxygenase YgiN
MVAKQGPSFAHLITYLETWCLDSIALAAYSSRHTYYMTICTVTASFEPIPEFREQVRKLLLEQAAIVRTEPGCEYYDLYDHVNGNLVFIEAWTTRQDWIVHNDAPTVQAINEGVLGKLLSPVLVSELYKAH